jgi:hypothetical protein
MSFSPCVSYSMGSKKENEGHSQSEEEVAVPLAAPAEKVEPVTKSSHGVHRSREASGLKKPSLHGLQSPAFHSSPAEQAHVSPSPSTLA